MLATIMKTTLYNFPYAGVASDSSLHNVGSNGYYWSRTAFSNTSAYRLYFDSSGVLPAYYFNVSRCLGFSIRCVATI